MNWVKCSDRLPEVGAFVLVLFPLWMDPHHRITRLVGDGHRTWWEGIFTSQHGQPTHWMPLPKPPVEVLAPTGNGTADGTGEELVAAALSPSPAQQETK